MTKEIIYYTDNRKDEKMISLCQKYIIQSELTIVSCSLKPINFGRNIVLENRLRSYPTMALQIFMALEESTADYVFFCEDDVLYHKSHFDYVPPTDDIYYYNINNWRWLLGNKTAITYDGLTSLSGLCVNRKLALEHYRMRLERIEEMGLDKIRGREPRWARKFGYEPGTKLKRRGGFSDDVHIKRKSEYPNIDIRHDKTFSKPKVTLDSFVHKPENWQERNIENIEGWDLKNLFNL